VGQGPSAGRRGRVSMASIGWRGMVLRPTGAVRRHRWLLTVATAVLAGLLLGYLAAARQPLLYEATARMLVEPTIPSQDGAAAVNPNRTLRNQAAILSSTPVLQDAARRFGDGLTLGVIRGRVAVETSTESDLITVRALDATPDGAARLADSVVQAYEEVVGGQLTAARNGLGGGVAVGEPAEAPQAPAQPRPVRMMAIGALLGLAAGGALAWWLASGRQRIAAVVYGRSQARPFRWFTLLLGLVWVGYMFFSKSFGYLTHIPGTPIFAGEIVLAVGLVEAVRARSLIRHLLKVSAPLRILLALMALSGIRLLWDLPTYGLNAVRDYSLLYYGVIAFLVAAATISDPTLIPRLLRWYRRILPWFLLWVPVAIFLARYQRLATVKIPDSTTSVNTFKGSDLVVMTTMALVFLWLGPDRSAEGGSRRRSNDVLAVVGIFALLVLVSQSRAVLVVIVAVSGTALYFLSHNRRRRVAISIAGGIAIVVVPVLLFNPRIPVTGRQLSLQQVGDNVLSIVSRKPQENETETGLQGTITWRQELFSTVLRNSLRWDRALTGRGFGPILSYDYLDRTNAPGAPPALRNAHNSHITLLARIGLPGFTLWVLLWVVWFRRVSRLARLARRGLRDQAVNLAVWLLAGVVGLLVVSFDDPTLETPQGAIWLWAMVGLAVAHTVIARPRRMMDPAPARATGEIQQVRAG
jgi:capsular polysaccharide biosynthesis protein